MKKTIIIVVVAILLGGGYFLYQKNRVLVPYIPTVGPDKEFNKQATQPQPEQSKQEATNPTAVKENNTSRVNDPGRFSSGEGEALAPDIQVWQIDYDGSQFAPKTLNIKVGDYVIFKNTGTTSFWPASDPHPTHTGYSGFDAGKAVAVGGKYQFQFEKVGTWGFHDHLNPSAVGTVIVTR
jgi:plastocyanin